MVGVDEGALLAARLEEGERLARPVGERDDEERQVLALV